MSQEILVEELLPSSANLITETLKGADGKKTLWLNGIFMQAETQNRNGRVYPRHEIQSAVDNLNESIKQNQGVLGELDHPQGISINLDRVSHLITEVRMVNNNAVGKAKILTGTPMGSIVENICEAGFRLGVSSRGTGNVNEGVVEGYICTTIDIVANPSAQGAVPTSIYESLNLSPTGREILTLSEAVRADPLAQAEIKKIMKEWMRKTLV